MKVKLKCAFVQRARCSKWKMVAGYRREVIPCSWVSQREIEALHLWHRCWLTGGNKQAIWQKPGRGDGHKHSITCDDGVLILAIINFSHWTDLHPAVLMYFVIQITVTSR